MRRFAFFFLTLTACGSSNTEAPQATPDAISSETENEVSIDAETKDVNASSDSSTDASSDTSATCVPKAGTTAANAYCDLFELAYFTMDGKAPRVELRGRVSPSMPDPACAVIDGVEVQTEGKTVATLTGTGVFASGSERALLATGGTFEALANRCAGDTNRFGGFGFVITGHMDGGTFTAHCADAEGGSRWPPAVRVTCHHNVDASPPASSAMVSSAGSFTSTSMNITAPHASGGALETVSSTLHVIPGFPSLLGSPPSMLAPFDSTGWEASLGESTSPTSTSISLFDTKSPLPAELCPPPTVPGPGTSPPPVFLARITGSGERGAYSTEAYVNSCTKTP
jgi:hypothetical protein